MMRTRLAIFFLASLAVMGCTLIAGVEDLAYREPATTSDPTEPLPESGDAPDAGDLVSDASPTNEDADTDAASPADDAGATTDAGADADTRDAAVPPLPACTVLDFLANDRRAPGASRTIAFPLAGPPRQYAPRCLRIKAGQSVTWQGDLVADPLRARSNDPPTPITTTATGNSVTFTFPNRGRYQYGSVTEPAMRGTIDVRP